MNTGAVGDRILDISVQSRPTSPGTHTDNTEFQDVTETLRTLVIPTVDPIKVTQTILYMQAAGEWLGLADLKTFDGDFWDNRKTGEALVHSRIECAGPSGIEIESVELVRKV